MKRIDGGKVAVITSKCGRKLKVCEVAGVLVEAIETIGKKNPIVIEAKETLGKKMFEQLTSTIITFYSLNLLAKTHDEKEIREIMKECEIEDKESEA